MFKTLFNNRDEHILLEELAWDNGFGENKLFAKVDEVGEADKVREVYGTLAFPSYDCVVPTNSILLGQAELDRRSGSLNELIVDYQGKRYAVGRLAVTMNPKGAKQSFKADKFREDSETVKLLAALAYLYPRAVRIDIGNLIVGLSLESFRNYKEEVESHYCREYRYAVPGKNSKSREMVVKIYKVTCRLQGIGAFYDKFMLMDSAGKIVPSEDAERLKQKRYGLVDVGSKTNDCFIAVGLKPIPGTEEVFDYGMSRAYAQVSRELEGCPAKMIEEKYFEYGRRSGPTEALFWKGREYQPQQIASLCETAFAAVGSEVAQRLAEKWMEQLDLLQLVLLCGGGAQSASFVAAFQDRFTGVKVEIVAEPQFANVKGYLKMHKFTRLHQKKAKRG
ncbi:MAG: ParM/StbA family protein [Bacillota bacterium]|jgi:hypothetical protein